MGTRRSILKAGLGVCTCTACGAALLDHIATTARADATTRVQGPGYDLRFIGAQRETVMNGKLAAAPDPPPLKRSDLRYVFDIKEDCNGKEAIQA
jgi:hypothetical protein